MELKEELDAMLDTQGVNTTNDIDTPVVVATDTVVNVAANTNTDTDVDTTVDDLRRQLADVATSTDNTTTEPQSPLDKFKEDIEFLTKEDLAALADKPELLNMAINNARRQTAEHLLSAVPDLINQAFIARQQKQEIHDKFYGDHKELIPYKGFVSTIAKDIAEKMKDKAPEEIMAEIAKNAKERLKLTSVAPVSTPSTIGVKPALRDAKGGARSNITTPSKSDIQAQFADMLGV